MTLHLTPVAAKDGGGTAIPGGIQQNDRSGVNTGPNDPVAILIDSTANEILGTTADAAAIQTDTTPLSFMSVVKQISKSIQAAAASLATLVSTGIIGTGTAGTPPGGSTVLSVQSVSDLFGTHKEVSASQTAQVLGATGAIGDYLAYVTVVPALVGCGLVTILDGSTPIISFVGGGTTPLPSTIPFTIQVGAFCTGAGWHITTGASVAVSAVGKFT